MLNLPLFKVIPIEAEFTEIAITDDPAIEVMSLLFSKEISKMEFEDIKQIIYGPVMIPNRPIYRNDNLGERFVVYDEEGVEKAAEILFKNGFKFNVEHSDKKVEVSVKESFFTKDENNEWGVPAGSWIVKAKILDSEYFNKLKSGEVGFSFQSMFENILVGTQQVVNYRKDVSEIENNPKKAKINMTDVKTKLLNFINELMFEVQPTDVSGDTATGDTIEPIVEPVIEPEVEHIVEPEIPEVEDEVEPIVEVEPQPDFKSEINDLKEQLTQVLEAIELLKKQPIEIVPEKEVIDTSVRNTNDQYDFLKSLNTKK